ncbi:hypothetical protein [Fibrobacter sp.]|uniref:hypothetical protein n=1 Tax=Fibrobacter sp. TaxID=35828 RepID=UPI002606CCB5|nr:hypothetical protein [Fibrobacter sp.]MDD5943728.1 hypothetical protein [Fibrobacter sp.]
MTRKIIPLLILFGMVAPSMAQLVKCNFEKCETGCDHFFGTGCSTTCYYVCEDGETRKSGHANMRYACQGVSGMFNNRPDCEKELQKQRESEKRIATGMENLKKEDGLRCDREQANDMSYCLQWVGQHYVDKVNDYLINGNNSPTLEKIEFNQGIDSIDCFSKFNYRDLPKGSGLEMSLAENSFGGCVYGYERSSCKKGMKILLWVSLKNGKQDKIVDECDFWNDCEKVDGLVVEGASWNIPGKTNCDAALREKMKEKTLDIRKKFK